MITDADKKTILEISGKYHAKRVLLFGSSLDPEEKESRDIDVAVEGISPKEFYRYYGDLMLSLSKPVDVIDISGTSKFVKLILQEGILLYG
jgi:predicted nucleotidyltransferase